MAILEVFMRRPRRILSRYDLLELAWDGEFDYHETVRQLIGDVDVVHTQDRDADLQGAEVSGVRAAAELGWRPRTSLYTPSASRATTSGPSGY